MRPVDRHGRKDKLTKWHSNGPHAPGHRSTASGPPTFSPHAGSSSSSGRPSWATNASSSRPSYAARPSNASSSRPSYAARPSNASSSSRPSHAQASSQQSSSRSRPSSGRGSGITLNPLKAVSPARIKARQAGDCCERQCCCTCLSDYCCQLPLHAARAFSSVQNNIASRDERNILAERLQVSEKGTVNTIVWRRSMLLLLVLAGWATCSFQALDANDEYSRYLRIKAVGEENTTYGFHANDTLSFESYTYRVSEIVAASVVRDVLFAQFCCECAIAGLLLVSVLLTAISLGLWVSFRISRKLMLTAWLLAFMGPFMVSALPTRELMRWDRFDGHRDDFLEGFSAHFKLDQRSSEVVSACTELRKPSTDQTLEDAKRNMDRLCGAIGSVNNGFTNWLSGNSIGNAKRRCEQMRQLINDGRVDEALDTGQELCVEIQDAITKVKGGEGRDLEFVQMAANMIDKAKIAAEMGIALLIALMAFKTLMPASVALAPALIRGALKVKVLVPQSSIPGMFVVVLPWLYCPLVWVVFNVAFQLVGNIWLFFGLLLQALAPMIYFVVGTCTDIPKPMDDQGIKKVLRWLSFYSLLLLGSTLGILGYWAFGMSHRGTALRALRSMLEPRIIASLCCSTMHKWFLTTVAGVDFMLGEIASQREFEKYLETGHKPGFKSIIRMFATEGERQRVKSMMAERTSRLDDLCQSLHGVNQALTRHDGNVRANEGRVVEHDGYDDTRL